MVERYNYSEGDECMLEDVHGAYVSYYDYADLEVENTKLEEALRECRAIWLRVHGEPACKCVGCKMDAIIREVLGDA